MLDNEAGAGGKRESRGLPMPASQLNITPDTPIGGNLVAGRSHVPHLGAGMRWRCTSPCKPGGAAAAAFPKNAGDLLVKDANGYWAGFVPGLKDGDLYRFYVVGPAARASSAILMRASSSSTGIPTATASCAIRRAIPGTTQISVRRLSTI